MRGDARMTLLDGDHGRSFGAKVADQPTIASISAGPQPGHHLVE